MTWDEGLEGEAMEAKEREWRGERKEVETRPLEREEKRNWGGERRAIVKRVVVRFDLCVACCKKKKDCYNIVHMLMGLSFKLTGGIFPLKLENLFSRCFVLLVNLLPVFY